MTKKYKIFIGIFFFHFLAAGFFCLFISKVNAMGVELTYPTVMGQALPITDVKFPDFAKYIFAFGMAFGFSSVAISMVWAGAMRLLSPAKPDLLASSKERFRGAVYGLLLLILTYLIITTINPDLSIFKLTELPPIPPPPVVNSTPAVYFYTATNTCPEPDGWTNTRSSIADFGEKLNNKITKVDITQDSAAQIAYFTILYKNPGFSGKCMYINGNTPCQTVHPPFASSASVYRFDNSTVSNPGKEVCFYRKSYFNPQGGYFCVSDETIRNIGSTSLYVRNLNDLKFTNVPEPEQNCTKYDKEGECTAREMPSLGGKNIASVKINGDYVVLFVYAGPGDVPTGPWTFCQEFPTSEDTNKSGPQQTKWENVNSYYTGQIPNYVVIIPIKP